jgi:hypothetical protein
MPPPFVFPRGSQFADELTAIFYGPELGAVGLNPPAALIHGAQYPLGPSGRNEYSGPWLRYEIETGSVVVAMLRPKLGQILHQC